MQVKRHVPLRISSRPPLPGSISVHIPNRKSPGHRTLEENARESFASEVMCLALSTESLCRALTRYQDMYIEQ